MLFLQTHLIFLFTHACAEGNTANGVSPTQHQTCFLMRLQLEKNNIPVYIHTCGAIGDRLDLMAETGADGLECLDPPPIGTCDLAQASAILGNRCFIKGNLDSVNEMRACTPEQVLETARKRLEIGKQHKGGYILSSACSVAPDVPEENLMILHKAVEKFG